MCPCPWGGDCTGWSLSSLPTQTILEFDGKGLSAEAPRVIYQVESWQVQLKSKMDFLQPFEKERKPFEGEERLKETSSNEIMAVQDILHHEEGDFEFCL